MARQPIDTTPPTGDPAPTAFNKINAMTAELYPLATGALQKTGGVLSGDFSIQKNVIVSSYLSPNGQVGYRMLVNISNEVDGGYTIQRLAAGAWSDMFKVNADARIDIAGDMVVAGSGLLSQRCIRTTAGTSSNAGYVSFHRLDGTRLGYVGWADGTSLQYSVENGFNAHSFVGNVRATGSMTATAFNPSSSADVKDFIEGYAGDACEELNRLAVCTYKYRPEFFESDKTYVGIIAENLADIRPDATSEETHMETYTAPIGEDEDGNLITEEREKIVPMTYDISQLLALSVRSHQQKSKRIRDLEAGLEGALLRIAALESAA
ncbi:hypothetical protein [Stenotrophomonas bentonitica]|uniref:tail fiber domain-containing protein n=1 Tax=Stenotrophomonas bentonitica TaxID=1450134 RepID=UPI00345E92FE